MDQETQSSRYLFSRRVSFVLYFRSRGEKSSFFASHWDKFDLLRFLYLFSLTDGQCLTCVQTKDGLSKEQLKPKDRDSLNDTFAWRNLQVSSMQQVYSQVYETAYQCLTSLDRRLISLHPLSTTEASPEAFPLVCLTRKMFLKIEPSQWCTN